MFGVRNWSPGLATILGDANAEGVVATEAAIGGIAEHNTVIAVEEKYGVPEAFFVWVGEEEFPGLAAVGGFVEAGLVAGAGGHDDGGVFVEGLDASEVEVFGSGGDVAGLPEVAAVFGAEDGAVGAAGPGYSAACVVNAAQAGGGVGVFDVPLGFGVGGQGCGDEDCGYAQKGRNIFCSRASLMCERRSIVGEWVLLMVYFVSHLVYSPSPVLMCQSLINKVLRFGLQCTLSTN